MPPLLVRGGIKLKQYVLSAPLTNARAALSSAVRLAVRWPPLLPAGEAAADAAGQFMNMAKNISKRPAHPGRGLP